MALVTTNTTVDDVLTTYLNKAFVSDLEFDLQHVKFTMKGDIPTGGGNILRFNEIEPPTRVGFISGTTALAEGSATANEITSITTTPTNVTLLEWGEFIKVSQFYELASQPGTLERMRKRIRDGALVSLDTRTRIKGLQQGTTAYWADTSAQGITSTAPASPNNTLGAAAIIYARKVLKDNLAQPFSGIPGHPDGHYAAILSEKQEFDVVSEVTTSRIYWTNCVVNVPGKMGQDKWVNGYMGSIYGVACYSTNNYATQTFTTVQHDVGFVFADAAVGGATIAQMQPQVILNDLNSPYKNVNTIAWHAFYEAAMISAKRVVKIYSAS